jgi:iron complex transport system ATP-binding protein
MKLEICQLACGYDKKTVIDNISLEIKTKETLCLLGPNGVGKTTFFKTLLGFMAPKAGGITINGEDLKRMSIRERAQTMAYVPQAHEVPFAFSVQDVVMMGRYVYLDSLRGPSQSDWIRVGECLRDLEIEHLRNRIFTQLSGGERQLVLFARALAQGAHFLVLDEPASNLDYGNQMQVLRQVKRLQECGKGIVMTTHSPDHALQCGTRVAIFQRNHPVKVGPPREVITSALMYQLYGEHVHIQDVRRKQGGVVRMCVPCLN